MQGETRQPNLRSRWSAVVRAGRGWIGLRVPGLERTRRHHGGASGDADRVARLAAPGQAEGAVARAVVRAVGPGGRGRAVDRLSFRRFAGLPLDGGVPDETTLCRFRNDLRARGLTRAAAGGGRRATRGARAGAEARHADRREPRRGGRRRRKGPDGRPVTVEREAGLAKRRGPPASASRRPWRWTRARDWCVAPMLTPANVDESLVADALSLGDEAAVDPDKGYDSAARRARLAERAASSTGSCDAAFDTGR